jgi:hypothetical protein
MVPPRVVAGFPASVRNNEHLDARRSDGQQNVASGLFRHRSELAAFGQKIVVRIDQKQSGTCGIIVKIRHANVAAVPNPRRSDHQGGIAGFVEGIQV